MYWVRFRPWLYIGHQLRGKKKKIEHPNALTGMKQEDMYIPPALQYQRIIQSLQKRKKKKINGVVVEYSHQKLNIPLFFFPNGYTTRAAKNNPRVVPMAT